MTTPSEWLKTVSQNGSSEISHSALFALSLIGNQNEETLWTILVLLAGCFSDLAKAGNVNSLPPSLDLRMAESTFMHLSSTMADAAQRLSEHGSTPLELPGFRPTIPDVGP